MFKMACPMRLVFLTMSVMIWLSIALTGFATIHWLLYIPALGTLFVAASGICLTGALFEKFC